MQTIKSPTLYLLSGLVIVAMLLFFTAYGLVYLFRHPLDFARRAWKNDRLMVIAVAVIAIAACFSGCATTGDTLTIPAPPPIELEAAS